MSAELRSHAAPIRRVVVADADSDHRAWLVASLAGAGYEVAEAIDGSELVELLFVAPATHFDLVVCAQALPGLRGTECLARASSRSHWILVVGSSDPSVDLVADQFGALAVLCKPFGVDCLRRVIERASTGRSGTHRRASGQRT